MIFDYVMRVELIKTNASDEDVARAAWVSNFGEDSRTKDTTRIRKLIDFLYRNEHMSPFEHGSFTFFVDVPIFVAREFMRHRTFSYNEVSGRYTEMKPRFYVPPGNRPIIQAGKIGSYKFVTGTENQYLDIGDSSTYAYQEAWNAYAGMRENGIANEVARNPLSLGMYTQFYATCNPRNLMHFLELRTDPQALWEIRDTAEQMEEYLEDAMPLTYASFVAGRVWKQLFKEIRESGQTPSQVRKSLGLL